VLLPHIRLPCVLVIHHTHTLRCFIVYSCSPHPVPACLTTFHTLHTVHHIPHSMSPPLSSSYMGLHMHTTHSSVHTHAPSSHTPHYHEETYRRHVLRYLLRHTTGRKDGCAFLSITWSPLFRRLPGRGRNAPVITTLLPPRLLFPAVWFALLLRVLIRAVVLPSRVAARLRGATACYHDSSLHYTHGVLRTATPTFGPHFPHAPPLASTPCLGSRTPGWLPLYWRDSRAVLRRCTYPTRTCPTTRWHTLLPYVKRWRWHA